MSAARPAVPPSSRLFDATRGGLDRAGASATPLGMVALLAARRLDDTALVETGASIAALIKAHREALAAAMADAEPVVSDPLALIRRTAALKLVRLVPD